MNKMVKSLFVFIFIVLVGFNIDAKSESYYSSNQDNSTQNLFFPKETALRDGYRILPSDWIALNAIQKKAFVIESIEEIKNKQKCFVANIADMPGLINNFDKAIKIMASGGAKTAIIAVLFNLLDYSGSLQCNGENFNPIREKLLNSNNSESLVVEVSKVYKGYTDFYEKNGAWFMKKSPPSVGEVCKHFIYNDYNVFPSGTVILSANYPLEFSYKIRSIKEINSFLQNDGLFAHYYEITFKCIE